MHVCTYARIYSECYWYSIRASCICSIVVMSKSLWHQQISFVPSHLLLQKQNLLALYLVLNVILNIHTNTGSTYVSILIIGTSYIFAGNKNIKKRIQWNLF